MRWMMRYTSQLPLLNEGLLFLAAGSAAGIEVVPLGSGTAEARSPEPWEPPAIKTVNILFSHFCLQWKL